MKRSIFRYLSVMIAAAATLNLSSCAQSSFRYSGDDLYSYHNIRLLEERDAAQAARERAEAEARQLRIEAAIAEAEATGGYQSYDDILVTDYETAYARRLRGFNSPTYRMPSSYYNFRYGSDYFLATSYDPAFYNVVVMGDEVWVEPRYISSMFGTWGAPSWNFGLGWNSRGGWNSWAWDPWWGWNSWGWDPWWGWNNWGWYNWGWYNWGWHRPPHNPGWHRPPGSWTGPSNRPSTGTVVGGSPYRPNRPGVSTGSTGIRQGNSSGVVSGGSSSSGYRTSGTRYGTSTTQGNGSSGVGSSTSSGNRSTSGGTVSRTGTNRSSGSSSTGVSSGSSDSRQYNNYNYSTPSRNNGSSNSNYSAPSRSSGSSGSSGSGGGSRTSGGRR